jgi:hypothetical protein
MEDIPWGEAEAGSDHEAEADTKQGDTHHEEEQASWGHLVSVSSQRVPGHIGDFLGGWRGLRNFSGNISPLRL